MTKINLKNIKQVRSTTCYLKMGKHLYNLRQ